MRWIEIGLQVSGPAEEAASAILLAAGSRGTSTVSGPAGGEAGVTVRGYAPEDAELPALLDDLRRRLAVLREFGIDVPEEPSTRALVEEDWATAWKRFYRPLRVGRRFVVCPSWEAYAPGAADLVLSLDPGMAFGTGLHPTTQLCLEALEETARGGERWLDWGTGSGILAIAAAFLGAGSVDALDNDPVAVEAARENVARNGVDAVARVERGDLPASGEYDGIVANILAPPIVAAASQLRALLRPGGRLIVSGLTTAHEAEVEEALRAAGFGAAGRSQREDWVCLVAEGSER